MKPSETMATHPDPAAIRRLIGGAAAPAEAREVVRHLLTGCAHCSDAARQTRGGLEGFPTAAQSYDPVFERLRERLAQDPRAAPTPPTTPVPVGPGPHELYVELMGHDAVEALMQVQSTRRYAYLALCELLLRKALGLAGQPEGGSDAAARPQAGSLPAAENGMRQAITAAESMAPAGTPRSPTDVAMQARCFAAAANVTEMLDLEIYGAPVVQDARAIAWTYFADPGRMHEDLRTAALSYDFAGRLLANGVAAPQGRADLLAVQASLAVHCGRFDAAGGKLTAAASLHRRAGQRHLVGRALLKKGATLGNRGEAGEAVRLLLAGSDCIEPRREPRLLAWTAHNLAWFLHEAGHTGQAAACLGATRQLYRSAHDRRDLCRLRWLEGKLASDFAGAESALLEARDGLVREDLGYEAALASMDLAVRYAGERRGRQMRRRADEMLPLFRSAGMYGDTLLALESFQRHGQDDDPSALLGDLDRYLQQSRQARNPPALGDAISR